PITQIDEMDNYVIACGIRGKKKWNALWTRRIKGMPEDCTESLSVLNQNRETIVSLLEPFENCSKNAKAITETLYQYIVTLQLQEKLELYAKSFTNDGNLAKAKEYSQVYKQVMVLLDQIVDLLGDEEMNVKEYAQILYAGIDEIQIGTIPQNVDQVVVGDIERTRLKDIKVLFFVGLNDGMIPKNAQKGGIISDVDREFLRSDEWELAPTPRQQMFIQKLYLYLNMTKPQDKLILSFSRIDGEGKSLRPAYLVDVIRKLFPTLMIQSINSRTKMEQIQTKGDGIFFLIEELQSYLVKGVIAKEDEELLLALLSLYDRDEIMKPLLQHMKHAAFFEYTRYPLTKDISTMLYGKILYHSISRIELFAGCEYAHFLQYGLNIQDRDTYSFENSDLGNLYHQVLELFARALEEEKLSWFTFQKEDAKRLLSQCVERVTSNYGDTILYSSARYQYAIKRLMRVLERTVDTLQYQLKQGSFQPSQFELSFSLMEDLKPMEHPLNE
ncbi:MAG: helicase-exonuclease AddAB subunit AddB, partial [Clostridiales bacterium]|nr:helicase-exonuclease AddAB subunit AddB [Clostridiales bacterium]